MKAPKLKRKKYADGSVDMSTWSEDQKKQFSLLTDDTQKKAFVDNMAKQPVQPVNNATAARSITQKTNEIAAANSEGIPADVNPGMSALQRAGQGAAIGGPWGAGIGFVAGIAEGLIGNNENEKRRKQAKRNAVSATIGAASEVADYSAMAEGGKVVGPGGPKSDAKKTSLPKGSFVVPAENSRIAEIIRAAHLGEGTTPMKGGGSAKVSLSNGEHVFTPKEVKTLSAKGLNLNALAPNATNAVGMKSGGAVGLADGSFDAEEYLKNPYVKTYLESLRELEQDPKNPLSGKTRMDKNKDGKRDSTAQGQYQFTKATRDSILKKYGFDAWKKDPEEQHKAAIALMKDNGALDMIAKGAFSKADAKLNATWPSLPGGSQATTKHLSAVMERRQGNINLLKSQQKPQDSTAVKPEEKPRIGSSIIPAFKTGSPPSASTSKTPVSPDIWGKDKYRNIWMDDMGDSNNDLAKPAAKQITFDDQWTKNPDGSYTQKSTAEVMPTEADAKAAFDHARSLDATDETDHTGDATTILGKTRTQLDEEAAKNWRKKITPAAGVTDPATDMASAKPATDGGRNIFEKLGGPAGLLALGQTGFGLFQNLNTGPRPKYEVSPELITQRDQALTDAKNGLDPATEAQAKDSIELNRRADNENIKNMSGGDTGVALANMQSASSNANRGVLALAAEKERIRMNKNLRADSLVKDVSAEQGKQFDTETKAFYDNQKSSSDLMLAGISNYFGNLSLNKAEDRADRRAKLYGTTNVTTPAPAQP